ncbi:MAG: uracil-DNA glycosylase family protein [Isosphaeraceae bacterium]
MTDSTDGERRDLIRQVRQRLEALGRAGLDRIPSPPALPKRGAALLEPPVSTPVLNAAREPAPSRRPVEPPSPTIRNAPASLFSEPELPGPVIAPAERPARLAALAAEVAACTKCPLLASTRTQTVFGEGSPTARLMFIGEAPGETEDHTGRPFVGNAGILLTDMITKGMGLAREDVYIANILKCRPPGNRDPSTEEAANCLPFLERQIAIIRPEFLCLLGSPAAKTLLQTSLGVTRLRGKWHRYRGIATIVTYHPSYLLRTPNAKKETWGDLQMLMKAMGLKLPERKKG